MPASTPADAKSRQSSGGKSFFSRAKLHKEKPSDKRSPSEENGLGLEPSTGASSISSRTSRHTHRGSIASRMDDDRPDSQDGDQSGLAMTAGVITSIPYDSIPADARSPIPVEYLPRADQTSTRREPLPHHLNKGGGDYHQYPAVSGPSNGSSHPSGPRPAPGSSHSSNSLNPGAGDRSTSFSTFSRLGSSSGQQNGASNGDYNSLLTNDSSNPRTSFDQASVYSTMSTATRGSSVFSSNNSSHTAIPSHSTLLPAGKSSSRQSHQSGFHIHHPTGFRSTGSFGSAEGFSLPRPTDDNVVEEQFLALMHKRGWHNLPEQARRQMLAYPAAKKWTLVHQDKLTEWEGEQKRRTFARQTMTGTDGYMSYGRADEEGSPEWYVRKVLDDSITAKQLQSLSVSLRTQPIR